MEETLLKPNDFLETPEWVYKPMGHFDLDPCAGSNTDIADVNWNIFRGENGLKREWFGFVWCNPPFSQKSPWIEKMVNHGQGILLLTDPGSAPWFGPLTQLCDNHFIMGKKINFIGGSSSNNGGTALFLFGEEAVSRIEKSGLPGHMNNSLWYKPRSLTHSKQ